MDEREVLWKAFIKRHAPAEKKMARTMAGLFNQQRAEVAANIKRNPPPKSVDKVSNSDLMRRWMFDKEAWDRTMAEAMRPHIEQSVEQAGKAAMREIGGGNTGYDIDAKKVQAFITRKATKSAALINRTTTNFLDYNFRDALNDGESATDIIARSGQVFVYSKRFRSVVIARTETTAALNFGDIDADRQSGEIWGNEWVAAMDERTRLSHMAINGTTAELGIEFGNGLQYPGDPLGRAAEVINCRCVLLRLEKKPQ